MSSSDCWTAEYVCLPQSAILLFAANFWVDSSHTRRRCCDLLWKSKSNPAVGNSRTCTTFLLNWAEGVQLRKHHPSLLEVCSDNCFTKRNALEPTRTVCNSMHCEKCGKQAFSAVRVKRINKYGVEYPYVRFVYYDARKRSKRRYCYQPTRDTNSQPPNSNF